MRVLWVDSENTFELQQLRNTIFNTIDESASVSLTLEETDGTPVSGESWPKPLQSIGDGRYLYSLNAGIDITPEMTYVAHFDVTGSRGEKATWKLKCVAKVRDA